MSEVSLLDTRATSSADVDVTARLLDATVSLVERWGISKTTMADIAREAGCSRATAYRAFANKPAIMIAAADREMARFQQIVGRQVDAAHTLEDALGAAMVTSHRFLSGHPALQFVLAHEPGLVLPFLGFGAIDTLYAGVRRFGAPHLQRFLHPERAGWAVEWAARAVLSYLFHPSPDVDFDDPQSTRSFVRRFLLPSLTKEMPHVRHR